MLNLVCQSKQTHCLYANFSTPNKLSLSLILFSMNSDPISCWKIQNIAGNFKVFKYKLTVCNALYYTGTKKRACRIRTTIWGIKGRKHVQCIAAAALYRVYNIKILRSKYNRVEIFLFFQFFQCYYLHENFGFGFERYTFSLYK